ncbi:MAG TPA: penicillin-binding protein 2 [Aeromicrobium sp.]|nr:penicillin-binding protein 2 [Aeromicrobium sp.]
MTAAQRLRLVRRRLRLMLIVVLAMFCLFALRLFQIQGIDSTAYAAMALQAGTAKNEIPAPRGKILDRNGAELATSIDAVTLTADPTLTSTSAPQIARVLIEHIGEKSDYFDLIDRLRQPNTRFVYLKKHVPAWKAAAALEELSEAKLPGVFTQKEVIRSYPGGTLAANLIGFTNAENVGVVGLEAQYDDVLTGRDGSRTDEVSATGQRIPMSNSTVVEMQPGKDVTTTIDRDLQWYADKRLAEGVRASSADWGLAITMDVKTCQIVQLSQSPTFDPDAKSHMSADRTVARSLQTVYEPGSVMKTITMAALADQGKIKADTPIVVPPSMTIDRFRIGDYWDHGTLHLTAAGVIAKSSNLGTIVAAQQMSDATFYQYLRKFGFGSTSGVDLPGESAGILKKAQDWTRANHATISFGQGISVTAMQMVRAVGAIANGGVMCEPTVVSSIEGDDGKQHAVKNPSSEQVVSKEAARIVTRMMEAVTADDGTAPAAQIDGYRVAGKTGTAWRVDPDTGRYVSGQNTVSFMGFAPADNPRFLTYIVLDKPYSSAGGGSTAAPVFQDIMSMALERFGVAPTGAKSPKVAQTW